MARLKKGKDQDEWGVEEGWLLHLFSVFWVSSPAKKFISSFCFFFCSFRKILLIYIILDIKNYNTEHVLFKLCIFHSLLLLPPLDMQDKSNLLWQMEITLFFSNVKNKLNFWSTGYVLSLFGYKNMYLAYVNLKIKSSF